jgi:hypothetical protein
MNATTRKPESTLILQATAYWAALVLANLACLGLMALLLFR